MRLPNALLPLERTQLRLATHVVQLPKQHSLHTPPATPWTDVEHHLQCCPEAERAEGVKVQRD
jgi:hypothetical protein